MKIASGVGTRMGGIVLVKRRADDLLGIAFQDAKVTVPSSSADHMLYRSGDDLYWWNGTVATLLGTAGAATIIPSLDGIFAGDKTLNVVGTTLTIDNSTGNNDVLTITNTGAGSGDLIQITNVGTGKDINGTSSTWSFSKLGAMTGLSAVLAGAASGTAALTLTAGDILVSDGALSVTLVGDNAVALTVVNDTATTASSVVISGSGAFTGSTTTSFMTITPSGLTTGTAVYLPVAALTTGKGLHIVANALTSGQGVLISSSNTTITGAGRLLKVNHTGGLGTSAIISEFTSDAADETVVLKATATGALALGVIFQVSGSSLTTGKAITAADLDALTTGMGAHIASAATAITTTGRLLLVDHTGATTSTGTLVEFKTAATDAANATTLLKLTMAASIVGVGLSVVSTTAMTTGSLIRATTSTAGAIATNGVYAFSGTGNFTNGASTLGMFHVTAASTTAGTIMSILGGAQTTGIALNITDPGTGMTSGSLLRVITATTGAVATNGIVSIQASGAYTSASNVGLLDVVASAITGTATVAHFAATAASQTATEILNITQSGATLTAYTGSLVNITGGFSGSSSTGNIALITGVHTTAGNALKIVANAITLGAATGLLISHTTSVLGAGSSLARISSTGVDTGTTTGVLLDLASTSAVGATQVMLTDSSADTAARIGILSKVTNAAAVLAVPFKASNVAVVNSKFTKMYSMTDGTKTCTIWLSQDNTSPNTVLTGLKGDICLNGTSGATFYCSADGTGWSTMG